MRNAVRCMGLFLFGVCALLIGLTLYGRETRQKELQNNLHNVAEQTVKIATSERGYNIADSNEMMADTIENMVVSMVTNSDLECDFYGVDAEKGLLSLKLTEDFKHPNGQDGKVEYDRTAICDKKEEDTMCTVKFYTAPDATDCYMSVSILTGDKITAPVGPEEKDREFAGWLDSNGYLADFSLPVQHDMTYYASWR